MSSYQQSAFSGRQLKDKIRASFSKAAINYDTLALFQKEVADELLSKYFTPPCPPFIKGGEGGFFSILDIGCGTGFLSHNLAERFPEANILGCDISHSMIKVASCKLQVARDKKIHLITTDGGLLPCKNETFDTAVSNLTYQWISNVEGSFREAHRVLNPGGAFIFSTLGPGTLKELKLCYTKATERFNKDGLPPFINFSGQETIISALRDAGFDNISMTAKDCIRTYHNMWELLKNMKSIGAGNPFKQGDKSLARGSVLKKMAEIYKERFKIQGLQLATCNYVYATYEVIFVKAVKL